MNNNEYGTGSEKAKTFLAGLLIGSALGASAALLKAPRSGEETREQLRAKASEAQSKAEEAATQLRGQVKETGEQVIERVEEARVRAQEMAEEASQRADELKTQAGTVVEEGEKILTQTADEIQKATEA